MASVKAKSLFFQGASFTIQRLDDKRLPTGNEFSVCGINGCTYAVGNPTEVDITDWCDDQSQTHAGLPASGTITMPVKNFDPFQEGQKELFDAELNTEYLLKAILLSGHEMTVNVKLANKMGFSAADQNQASSQIDFKTITTVVFKQPVTTP